MPSQEEKINKNTCGRCGSFNVNDNFVGQYKIIIYHKSISSVWIEPTGEFFKKEYPEENKYVSFSFPICQQCEESFKFWLSKEAK